MPEIIVAILAHHDLPRLERAVDSAMRLQPCPIPHRVHVVLNSMNEEWAVSARAHLVKRWPSLCVTITPSNGKPGRGKNYCLLLGHHSDTGWVMQLDGDDMLYPTAVRSLHWHIERNPGLDMLATVPLDCIGGDKGIVFPVKGGTAGIWTGNKCWPFNAPAGPAESEMWYQELPVCPARPMAFSRRFCLEYRFDEDMGVGEDHLLLMEALAGFKYHGLRTATSMAIDMWVADILTPDSIQKEIPQAPEVLPLKNRTMELLPFDESNISELPMYWPPPLLNPAERQRLVEEWAEI